MRKRLLLPMFLLNVFGILVFSSIDKRPERKYKKVYLIDQVEIVANSKLPESHTGRPIRITFTVDLTIGVTEGDENFMYGSRVYFNTDKQGNFYVNDWDQKRILKYDSEGQYLLTMGREGQGPGDFGNAWRPHFDIDENLYVFDLSNHRISYFSKEGNFLKLIKLPQNFTVYNIFTNGSYTAVKRIDREEKDGIHHEMTYGVYDSKFIQMGEIHRYELSPVALSGRDSKSRAQFTADILSREALKPSEFIHWLVSEDENIYLGYPSDYSIKVFNRKGRLVREIQRIYDPIKVTQKDKEHYFHIQETEFFRFIPTSEEIKKDVKKLVKFPKYKPAYQGFSLMENGWLLVKADFQAGGTTLFDVFDGKGKYIAQFKTSVATENLYFKNGKAYALAIEEYYRFIKRYHFEIQEFKGGKWVKAQ